MSETDGTTVGAAAEPASGTAGTGLCVRLMNALEGVLSCSRDVINLAVWTFAAGGHLLLEDVPGVGKTTLARALAIATGGESRRIQFTPDLLPGDLTGVGVWNAAEARFVFHPGPLFANVVIADEINRANPKTQAAMLEAMGEGAVSVDGTTHPLPDPYFVVATQNPIELEGTYPLPEAQLDRFLACTGFGYPTAQAETAMVMDPQSDHPLARLHAVCSMEEAQAMRRAVRRVTISEPVAAYIVALVAATREHEDVRYGASPRASLHVGAMARARAYTHGRDCVLPDDVQAVVIPTLAHRLVLEHGQPGNLEAARQILAGIVTAAPVPRAR